MARRKKTSRKGKSMLRKTFTSLQSTTKKFLPNVKRGIEGIGAKVVPTAKNGIQNLFGLLKMPKMKSRKSRTRRSRKSRK